MTDLQEINIGSAPDDGTGDPLRTAFDKINDNFAELNADITFTTTYKGSCPYMRDYVGLHDASGGGVPSTLDRYGVSFTASNAKRGDIALILVAGTINGIAVSRGDLIQANVDGPNAADEWDVIKDCTSEYEAAVEAANGKKIKFKEGTYLITSDPNPDARVNQTCDENVTILNRLDNTSLYQTSNATYATTSTTQRTITSVALEDYTDPAGNATDNVTTFLCATVGHAATFVKDSYAVVTCSAYNPYTGSQNFIGEPFRVLDSDPATGKVYATERLAFHAELEALDTVGSPNASIRLNTINDDRRARIANFTFCAAPILIGNSGGWWNTLFGTEVTATITGNSGSVRTISSTGHNLVNGNLVQVGTVSGATHTSCLVSNASANAFDITVPSTKDYDGTSPSIPTSGTLYYRPAFDHRNTAHHGNAVVLEHAHGSEIKNCKFDRLWTGGLMKRYSSYCLSVDNQYLNLGSAHSDNNNLNGRLGYGEQDYALAKKNRTLNMVATGGRHPRTDSAPETGSAYNPANWYRHHGSAIRCEYLNCHFEGSNGSGGDTHPGSRETTMEFNSRDPNRGAWGGSYFGFHGQARSSGTWKGTWSGGTHGIRVATEEIPGDVVLDLDINDLNWDATDVDTSESAALRVDSQSGLTNKARVIGKLRCRNAGIGIHLADEADVNLEEYIHKAITSKAAYLIDDSKLHIDECILDFRNNPRNLSARDAFVMDDASQITIGRLIIRQGAESDQPTAIFKDNDNVSGKLVDIQHLIYDDPDNVGPIPLVTPGREGNFTWLSSRFKHYVAGRYYFPQFFIGTGSAGAVSAGRLYAVPIDIYTPTTFTKIGINVTTGATGSPAVGRLGIYKDQKGVPGDLVVDAGEVDVTTIAAVEATISKTLFGRYWLAVIFESASSLQITLQSSASTNVGDYGAEGPIGGANVLRPVVAYGALPSTYPSVTSASFDTANIPRIWLRAGV